jgi:hypothetical protein
MWIEIGLLSGRISWVQSKMLCIRADLPVTLLVYLRTLFQSAPQFCAAHRLPKISRYEELKICRAATSAFLSTSLYQHIQDGWQEVSIGEVSIEEVSIKAGECAPKEVHARRL